MDNKLNYTEENEEREDGKLSYRTPIYLQLREIIRNRIEEGEYLPGTAIPSENKLAETYGINRLTVRNAVDTLVNEGILRRVQGKGVFVVGDKYEENLDEHGGFVNVMSSGTKRVSIKVVNSSVFTIKDIFAFYGIEISSMQQTMEIIDGTSKIKKLLDIPNGVALIMLSCDYWDNNGRAIAYSRSFIRSDRTSFTIQLHE